MNKIILSEKEQKNGEVRILVRESEMWLDECGLDIGLVHLEDVLEEIESIIDSSKHDENLAELSRVFSKIQECFLILGYDCKISEFRIRVRVNAYQTKFLMWRNALEKIQ